MLPNTVALALPGREPWRRGPASALLDLAQVAIGGAAPLAGTHIVVPMTVTIVVVSVSAVLVAATTTRP